MKYHRPSTSQRRHPRPAVHRGVALIVALVVLLVISGMSVGVMRGAMSSDLVVNNARVQMLAEQAAMTALRYCETELFEKGEVDLDALPAAAASGPAGWQDLARWTGNGAESRTVPQAWMVSASSSYTLGRLPECLFERTAMANNVYIITARGFSPDYTEDEAGRTISGSTVWMQSTVAW